MELTREQLTADLLEAEAKGAARGAQAMEAHLRPQLEAWREAAKWIAAGGLGLGAVGAALAFIYGFTIGAR